jgi:hypothetical protein
MSTLFCPILNVQGCKSNKKGGYRRLSFVKKVFTERKNKITKRKKSRRNKQKNLSLLNMESAFSLVDSPSLPSTSPSLPSTSTSLPSTSFFYSWKTWAILFVVVAFLGFNIFLFLGKESNDMIDTIKRFFTKMYNTNKLFHSHSPSTPAYEKPTHLNNVNEVHAPPDMSSEELQPPIQSAPTPDQADSLIQTQGKAGWCSVGEDRGYRSCVQVGENDTCLSGDIFPTKDKCINPKLRY